MMQDSTNSDYEATQFLERMEESLPKYNSFIVKKFHNFYTGGDVLDFGAGTGTISEIWNQRSHNKPICIEIDSTQKITLETKGFNTMSSLKELNRQVNFVFTSNVLEHIKDDVLALQEIYSILCPKGRLAIYVPALPFLFSELDKSVGHYRRYQRKELINKVEQAGFYVHTCYFNDSVGVLASIAIKIFGFRQGKALGASRSLRFYDSYFFPISLFLDSVLFKKFIGKNLFLFAEKLDQTSYSYTN